jgi:hypothetical protein
MLETLSTYLWTYLREHLGRETEKEDLQVMKVSDAYDQTDAISLFIFERGCSIPTFFVKISRDATNASGIRAEFNILSDLASRLSGTSLVTSIPRPLGLIDSENFTALVTTALPGQPLARMARRRYFLLERGSTVRYGMLKALDWLIAFQEATISEESGFCLKSPDDLAPAHLLEAGIQREKYHRLMHRAASITQEFRCTTVASQGSFRVENVLLDRNKIAVANWGGFCPRAHPLMDFLDLFFSAGTVFYGDHVGEVFLRLATPSGWLHDAFRQSLDRFRQRFEIPADLLKQYFFSYAVQRLERASTKRDPFEVEESVRLMESFLDHENAIPNLFRSPVSCCSGSSASAPRRAVRIKGALHIHSTLSRDGTMTIAELVQWYRQNGYQFLAMGEHAEDLDEAKVQALREQSIENSNDEFCVIPGIEFAANNDIHILGIGVVGLIRKNDPVAVVEEIHEQGGLAILAHPKRIRWECPTDVLLAVDAAEIWNVRYDGKYLPPPEALSGFRKTQQINPRLLAVASQDFHQTASFYNVAVEMDGQSLTPEGILRNLRQGRYAIRSRFFRADSGARLSRMEALYLRLLSPQLNNMRKARSFFLPWSS